MEYYFKKTLKTNIVDVRKKLTEELKNEGFGIISEISLHEKFKEKLNIDRKPYFILGACNPQFAHNALGLDEYVGLLLPCNIVLFENEDESTEIAVINAVSMMNVTGNKEIESIAESVNKHLLSAFSAL